VGIEAECPAQLDVVEVGATRQDVGADPDLERLVGLVALKRESLRKSARSPSRLYCSSRVTAILMPQPAYESYRCWYTWREQTRNNNGLSWCYRGVSIYWYGITRVDIARVFVTRPNTTFFVVCST
jgi:hypothetical protein